MIRQITPLTVHPLSTLSDSDLASLEALLPMLSTRFEGTSLSHEHIQTIISSPFHDQLVARLQDETIVGTASLSLVLGLGAGRTAWLDDFVVDTSRQGLGIGSALWNGVIAWCKENGVQKLEFTSKPDRASAHEFYKRRGAEIRNTYHFRKLL